MPAETKPEDSRIVRPWYRRDPWYGRLPRPLARLETDFESLMDRLFGGEASRAPGWSGFTPVANLAETENAYEVTIELPGVKPSEVLVELRNGDVWISGEKKAEPEQKGKDYHRVERTYGEFRRVIPLPGDVAEDQIEARAADGVLCVVLPKRATTHPKQIPVKT